MRRDPGLATVLSWLVWGLGFVYLGRLATGLFWSVLGIIIWPLAIIGIGVALGLLTVPNLPGWVYTIASAWPFLILLAPGLWLLQVYLTREAAEDLVHREEIEKMLGERQIGH